MATDRQRDEKSTELEIEELTSEEAEGVAGGECSATAGCGGACSGPPDLQQEP